MLNDNLADENASNIIELFLFRGTEKKEQVKKFL